MSVRYLSVFWLLWGLSTAVSAIEIHGVQVPDEVSLGDGRVLQLNGAGVRKKFFVKVYVGALYLTSRKGDVRAVLDASGPKRVVMHFLYDEVPAAKLIAGWREGFRANLNPDELDDVRERLDVFNAMFGDMRAGDEITLTYEPSVGTTIEVKGVEAGVIDGEDFFRALLLVWLGDKPADRGLKKSMLDQE